MYFLLMPFVWLAKPPFAGGRGGARLAVGQSAKGALLAACGWYVYIIHGNAEAGLRADLEYSIAVRTMCDFTARRGDLSSRFVPAPSAQQGMAGHAILAARRGIDYQREVTLAACHRGLTVRGRADGYDPEDNRLEEFKTHRGNLERMPANQRALHWAQLKTYGALL